MGLDRPEGGEGGGGAAEPSQPKISQNFSKTKTRQEHGPVAEKNDRTEAATGLGRREREGKKTYQQKTSQNFQQNNKQVSNMDQ